jgi:5-methylcytosine-specific restriction protein B
MIHLFGITYAEEISKHSIKEIIRMSELNPSYGTEVSKGIKLAKYVKPI